MAAKTFSITEAKAANFSVIEDGRGTQAVHDVVTAMRANRRQGNASTKTRGEVAATGKKPYRQKGTGNARRGGNASPVTRGGGVVFGPRPRDYSKTVNKKTRRMAFSKAISSRIAAGDVSTVAALTVADGKTKSFVAAVAGLTDAKKVLIIGGAFDNSTYLAGRNAAGVQLATAADVNTEQLLRYDAIIIVDDALETLAGRTA
jgi:large subunit ribosomal protein L4